jgi:hypothetical protein
MRAIAIALACLLCGAGCATKEQLTSRATGCGTRAITILPSDFQRLGVETAWCASCKDKRYLCRTNAERSQVECNESREGDRCH